MMDLSETQRRAFGFYLSAPDGLTAGDLANLLDDPRQNAGRIQSDLWRKGLLLRTGKRRRTDDGGMAEVYVACFRPEAALSIRKPMTYEQRRRAGLQLMELLRSFHLYDPQGSQARGIRNPDAFLQERFADLYMLGDENTDKMLRVERRRAERRSSRSE